MIAIRSKPSLLTVLGTLGFPGGTGLKSHLPMQDTKKTQVQSLGQEDPLERGMATHSSVLAWKIPWTNESDGLQPMGGHDWAYAQKKKKQHIKDSGYPRIFNQKEKPADVTA